MKTSINIWTASNVLSFQSLFSWLCKIWEGIQHEQPSVQGHAGHSLQQPPSLCRLQDDPHLRGGGVEYPRRAAFTVTSLSLRIRWHNRCKDVGSSRILRQFISLVFSLFMDFGSLCNEEKPEDKEEAALKESKIWVQMQRLWQTTEGFKRSMQHWTQAMAVPRGLEGLLLRLAKCLVLLLKYERWYFPPDLKYELQRLKGLSRKLTMSLYQNSATAPKPLWEPGVWPSALCYDNLSKPSMPRRMIRG